MLRYCSQTRWYAAWLFERLAVVAMLGALTATLAASTGVLKERARRSVCMSHLRSIGRALAMYSQDYGGLSDPTSVSEVELPPTLVPIVSGAGPGKRGYGITSADTFHCPDSPVAQSQPAAARCDYLYQRWPDSLAGGRTPPFAVALARRGMAFPIVLDLYHAVPTPARGRSRYTQFVMVVRLDGRVSARRVAYPGYSWTW